MKLLPNTYEGLTWGLINFDGIETDIRLTKDKQLVIYHDAYLESGKKIFESTLEELIAKKIPSLEKFFSIQQVIDLSKSKQMYIELKPNCDGTKRIVSSIKETFFDSFENLMSKSEIDPRSINIISFSQELLEPFAEKYRCYPLLPDVNECSDKFVTIKAMPQVLGRSLASEMKKAEAKGFAGVFFARQYIIGFPSFRHPSYDESVKIAEEKNMLLGTNLGTPDLEPQYAKFARFSDKLSQYPRYAKEGDGPIIAHRGTGTKGVEIPDKDGPQITL